LPARAKGLSIIAGWLEKAPDEPPDIEDAMSADPHYQATEEAHTGPIKNPKQLLLAVFFSFIVPILIIVGLVSYVVSGTKPAGTAEGDNMALYGVTQESRDREVAERLKKVGSIEIRDANRPLAAGEAVFKAQCVACHGAPGIPGAPHLNDAAAWGPRIGQGYATLLEHALKGKGAMPAQGGGDFEDIEIGRAVVYLANAGGAKFPVPDRPAAAAAPAEGASAAASAPAAAAASAPAK
jgi:cytochrome c5